MVVLNPTIDIEVLLTASVNASTRKNFDRPEADLRRWMTAAVVPEDTSTYEGMPRKAKYWVRVSPLLSSTGEHLSGQRRKPHELITGADMRWLPYASSWNATTGTWSTWGASTQPASWSALTGHQPVLGTATYRLGREVISVPQMRFSAGQYLTSMIGAGVSSAVGWTMSFVALLNAPKSSNYPLMDWGIPGWNGTQTVPVNRPYIYIGEQVAYGWGKSTGTVDPIVALANMRPAFITMVVNPPLVHLFVSAGPRFTFRTSSSTVFGSAAASFGGTGPTSGSTAGFGNVEGTTGAGAVPSNTVMTTPMQFFLGNSTDTGHEPVSFALLETSLWSRALSDTAVSALNSNYASVYGASSDW